MEVETSWVSARRQRPFAFSIEVFSFRSEANAEGIEANGFIKKPK